MKISNFIVQSLTAGTGVSEKRATRMFITVVLMTLTVLDFSFNNCVLRTELFYGWLGAASYDGWRISQEKKLQTKTETTVMSGDEAVQKSSETKVGNVGAMIIIAMIILTL